EIADAVMADLAVALQPGKARQRLGQWNRAAPMQQIKIDAVGPEPLQATLACFDDPLLRGVVRQYLADDEQPLAQPGAGLGNDLLGSTAAVHLGRVDQGQAEIDPELDRGRLVGGAAAVLAHMPGALAK